AASISRHHTESAVTPLVAELPGLRFTVMDRGLCGHENRPQSPSTNGKSVVGTPRADGNRGEGRSRRGRRLWRAAPRGPTPPHDGTIAVSFQHHQEARP